MFESWRQRRPELTARARSLGKDVFELLNPLSLPPEGLSHISRLDLREPTATATILVTREMSIPRPPEKPFPGQIALRGYDELVYVKPVVVPARQLYP